MPTTRTPECLPNGKGCRSGEPAVVLGVQDQCLIEAALFIGRAFASDNLGQLSADGGAASVGAVLQECGQIRGEAHGHLPDALAAGGGIGSHGGYSRRRDHGTTAGHTINREYRSPGRSARLESSGRRASVSGRPRPSGVAPPAPLAARVQRVEDQADHDRAQERNQQRAQKAVAAVRMHLFGSEPAAEQTSQNADDGVGEAAVGPLSTMAPESAPAKKPTTIQPTMSMCGTTGSCYERRSRLNARLDLIAGNGLAGSVDSTIPSQPRARERAAPESRRPPERPTASFVRLPRRPPRTSPSRPASS